MSGLEVSSGLYDKDKLQFLQDSQAVLLRQFQSEIYRFPLVAQACFNVRKISGPTGHGSLTMFRDNLGITASHVVNAIDVGSANISPVNEIYQPLKCSTLLVKKDRRPPWVLDDFAVLAMQTNSRYSFTDISDTAASHFAFIIGYPDIGQKSDENSSIEHAIVSPVIISHRRKSTIVINPVYKNLDYSGISGGVLVNENGELMGIAVAGSQSGNYGLCVSIKHVLGCI